MLRHISIILAMLGAAFLMPMAHAQDSRDTITILHTNDMHAHLLPDSEGRGGMAQIAAYFKEVRSHQQDVLVVDAGDMTVGTPVSTFFKGKPIFDVMNAMGYDAATIGNHEYDNGEQYVFDFRDIADFPLVSCNVTLDGKLMADEAALIKDVDGVKVGLVGLTTHHAVQNEKLLYLPMVETVQKAVDSIRQESDVVVLLSHQGYEEDRKLAAKLKGVDIIIGGHSHTTLRTPSQEGQTYIVQAGSYTRYVGRLDLVVDTEADTIADIQYELISIPTDLEPEPQTLAKVTEWEGKVSKIVDEEIGHNPTRQSQEEVRKNIQEVWRRTFKVDAAYQNSGGTRAPLDAGPITIRDIMTIMPFDNHLVILKMSAEDIADATKGGVQLSGEKEKYTFMTNSYKAKSFIEKYGIPESDIERNMTNFRDPIIDFIREQGHLNPDKVEDVEEAA